MRAAVFHGAGSPLVVERTADPTPGERQVVVRVERCGICGTDLTMTGEHGLLHAQPGDVLGHEYGGEVVAVGRGADKLAIGDRISALSFQRCCGRCENCRAGHERWCTGDDKVLGGGAGFAEYALVGEPQAVKLLDGLSWEDAALVEPIACGLHGIDLSDLTPGTNVAVIGAGPIALGAVLWARRRGAGRIVVTATSTRRERIARILGATDFVTEPDPREAVLELAGGPPPLVVEGAGVPGTLALAIDLVAPRGTVTVLGCCAEPDTFVPLPALFKEVRIQYSFTYGSHDFESVMRDLAAHPEVPRAMVTSQVSLDGLPGMLERLRGPNAECKVLVSPFAT